VYALAVMHTVWANFQFSIRQEYLAPATGRSLGLPFLYPTPPQTTPTTHHTPHTTHHHTTTILW
jgi:hypothetical protein